FCQAEDGIRDFHVTGVQTCALPIFTTYSGKCSIVHTLADGSKVSYDDKVCFVSLNSDLNYYYLKFVCDEASDGIPEACSSTSEEIGRASCRERVSITGGAECGRATR